MRAFIDRPCLSLIRTNKSRNLLYLALVRQHARLLQDPRGEAAGFCRPGERKGGVGGGAGAGRAVRCGAARGCAGLRGAGRAVRCRGGGLGVAVDRGGARRGGAAGRVSGGAAGRGAAGAAIGPAVMWSRGGIGASPGMFSSRCQPARDTGSLPQIPAQNVLPQQLSCR